MSIAYYTTRRGDGPWNDVEIRFELYAGYTTATEMRRNPRNEGELEGRTITIHDTAKFLKALKIKGEADFDRYMEKIADDGKLDIDWLQRRCEYHDIKYKVSGTRLQTVWRNYIKECRIKLAEAVAYFRGEQSNVECDYDAIEYLSDAADVKIPEACGLLAQIYARHKDWHEAQFIAQRGANLKDGLSMYVLGLYNTDHTRNTAEAVKWFVKAVEKGIPDAVERLSGLICDGKVSPESINFTALLQRYAHIKQ